MKEESIDKLRQLVEKRRSRGIAGGEIFAMWGFLNLISFTIHYFFINSIIIWIVMLGIGIILQIFYVKFFLNNKGYQLFWFGKINNLWIFMLVLLPFIFIVFPFLLKLYTSYCIYPLILLWLSIGMFVSGLIVEQWSMKIAGMIFLASSILLSFFMDKWNIIYPLSIIFGLIIPGIWSKYEEKKRG